MELIYSATFGIFIGLLSAFGSIFFPKFITDGEVEPPADDSTSDSQSESVCRDFLRDVDESKRQILALTSLSVIITVWIITGRGWTWATLALLLLSSGMLSIGLADWRTRLIPDALTLPLLWIGMLIQLLPATQTVGIERSLIGAVLGYMLPWTLGVMSFLTGRRDSVGGGDLKFTAMIGAWLGPIAVLWVLFAASLGVVLAYLATRLRGRSAQEKMVAFGPWLAASGIGWILIQL
jgi:prepilin signal peptidase PulO-like enzyme (type II secretory pathway)